MSELSNKYSRNIGLLLLGSLFFLGGCSNEEEIKDGSSLSPQPVLFNAAVESVTVENKVITRAGDDSDPSVDSLDDMVNSGKKVLIYGARYANGGSADWTVGADNLFMNNVTGPVVKEGDSRYKIDYSPLQYYYPEDDDKYDFQVFFPAPHTPSSGVTILNNGTQSPRLRVDLQHRPDLLKATVNGAVKKDQPNELEFKHLLTSVVLKIRRAEADGLETPEELKQDVFVNRVAMSGMMRGTYNIAQGKFEATSSNDLARGVTILDLGYNRDSLYLVPSATDKDTMLLREFILFPVASTASKDSTALQRYFFNITLNERQYSLMLPPAGSSIGEWKPGERYTYLIKVNKADIYLELNAIKREKWDVKTKEKITIGVGATK